MNSNRSSNQGQAKAKGKNGGKRKASSQGGGAQKKRRVEGPSRGPMEAAPLAQARQNRTRRPDMQMSVGGDGRVRIRHREYIGDVLGSVAFTATAYAVNPGMLASFPWLSTLASLYESFVFKNLKYEFETQKSASTNGTVMMAIDFDAADAAPTTKAQLMAYNGAVRSGVWQECAYVAAPANLVKFGPRKFVRSAVLPANLDIKTYDVGNLFVATQGCADATAIGELYVSYDVEFESPQQVAANQALPSAGFYSASTTAAVPFQGAVPYSTGALAVSGTGTTLTVTGAVIGQEYLLVSGATTAGGASTTTLSAFSGATLKSSFALGTGTWYTVTATAGTITCTWTQAGNNTNELFLIQAIPTQSV